MGDAAERRHRRLHLRRGREPRHDDDALWNVTASAYDDANQLVWVTDPLPNVTSYTYDDAGRK